MLKVLTDDVSEKKKVMSKQRDALKAVPEFEMTKDKSAVGYSRYFRDDLTNYQRKQYADLKEQRNKLNESVDQGFIWRIRDFELVKHRLFQTPVGMHLG